MVKPGRQRQWLLPFRTKQSANLHRNQSSFLFNRVCWAKSLRLRSSLTGFWVWNIFFGFHWISSWIENSFFKTKFQIAEFSKKKTMKFSRNHLTKPTKWTNKIPSNSPRAKTKTKSHCTHSANSAEKQPIRKQHRLQIDAMNHSKWHGDPSYWKSISANQRQTSKKLSLFDRRWLYLRCKCKSRRDLSAGPWVWRAENRTHTEPNGQTVNHFYCRQFKSIRWRKSSDLQFQPAVLSRLESTRVKNMFWGDEILETNRIR